MHIEYSTDSTEHYIAIYGTAHVQVYNRTSVLETSLRKVVIFCQVYELYTSSKLHVKIFTAPQEYSSIETHASYSSALE